MKFRLAIVACAGVLSAVTAPGAGAATVGLLEFAEPGSVVNGRSIGNMAAQWWKHVLETPMSVNPAAGGPYDPGPLEGEGTSFLYGLPPDGPTVGTLEASVRRGQALLLPLRPLANFRTDPEETPEVLFEQLEPLVDSVRNLRLEVNGVDFETATGRDLLGEFRERYPADPGDVPFGIALPETDAFAGLDGFEFDLMVADGHWLLFPDVPLGEHTLRVSYDNVGPDGGVAGQVAVTHQVSAVPGPAPLVLMVSALGLLAGLRRLRAP